jgi:hypothetical protein
MKKKIEKFFKEDRTYQGAIKLYNEIGNSLAIKKQLNMQPEEVMKGVLFDQLRILAELTTDQYKLLISTPVAKNIPQPVKVTESAPEMTEKKVRVAKSEKAKTTAKKKTHPKK